jgi:hypothetical protein
MKHTMNKSRSAIGAGFALALLTSVPLWAQGTPTTFNLTGVNGESLEGVYTSPYLGNVGGAPYSTATIPVICDDFSDNSYIPESWTTYVTSLTGPMGIDSASSPLSYLKWNGANSQGSVDGYAGWDLTQAQAYTVAAILTLDILNPNNTAQAQEDYSYALWELFDPTAAAGALVTAHPAGDANWGSNTDAVVPWLTTTYSDPGDLASATQDLETAIHTNQSVLNNYAVTIYSYDFAGGPPSCGTPLVSGNCSSAPPQEFISLSSSPGTNYPNTPVPEPSSLAVLGTYSLFGGAGLVLFGWRRIFRADS